MEVTIWRGVTRRSRTLTPCSAFNAAIPLKSGGSPKIETCKFKACALRARSCYWQTVFQVTSGYGEIWSHVVGSACAQNMVPKSRSWYEDDMIPLNRIVPSEYNSKENFEEFPTFIFQAQSYRKVAHGWRSDDTWVVQGRLKWSCDNVQSKSSTICNVMSVDVGKCVQQPNRASLRLKPNRTSL